MDDLRTFKAKSIQEAIALVRKELGPDASVLHTRKLSGGVFSWLLNSPRFEVTASATIQAPSRFDLLLGDDEPSPTELASTENQPASALDEALDASPPRETLQRETTSFNASRFADVYRQTAYEIESEPAPLPRAPSSRRRVAGETHEFALYSKLLDLGFAEALARRLSREAVSEATGDDPEALLRSAAYLAAAGIPIAEPWELTRGTQRRVALVGPTGVGKTTTIAKLAADLRLRHQRRVGMITVDTYRIAAVDQLQTYASIIEIPCEVVSSPEEMRAALTRLRDCEFLFLDTAGRGPFDALRMHELTRILQSFDADEVHLALCATNRAALLETLVERFSCARPTHLTLTKIDECDGLGPLAEWMQRSSLPLRYVTTGQDVPQDYAEPTLEILADAFMNRR